MERKRSSGFRRIFTVAFDCPAGLGNRIYRGYKLGEKLL